ncbi:MAG: hemolysin family protein [Candidatus Neomarinimicrobiota bacterium]|nr:hemolysin family protein [Candidatus Neomarinimicrobiota bacterium]
MILGKFLLFLALLALSALFSGAEAAYFLVSKRGLTSDETEEVAALLKNPKHLLITLLTGNTIANTGMAILAALITADIASRLNMNTAVLMALETVVITLTILLISEITPKILAIRDSERFAVRVSLPLRIFMLILYPIAVPLYGLTHLLSRLFRFKSEMLFDSEDELVALADLGAESGSIEPEESEMIKSVFDYGDTAVREIMVPRIDIVGIDNRATIDEAITIIKESKLSKFPVYNGNLDSIEGILYAKDVLPHINGGARTEAIAPLLREPYFVPESKQIASLLKEFQRRKNNVAIVVDEYGGTAGLVTVEDIVEEVVGEIRDEFDRETPMVISTGVNRWLVDARQPIHDLEDELPIKFEEEREFDTLGGFFFSQFGDIPTVGTNVVLDNFRFQVRTMEANRILKIEIFREERVDEER